MYSNHTPFCLHVHTHKKVVLVSLAKYYSYFDSLNGNGDVSVLALCENPGARLLNFILSG